MERATPPAMPTASQFDTKSGVEPGGKLHAAISVNATAAHTAIAHITATGMATGMAIGRSPTARGPLPPPTPLSSDAKAAVEAHAVALSRVHPLNPLSPSEIEAAVAIVKTQCAHAVSDKHFFIYCSLREPPRQTVWTFEHLTPNDQLRVGTSAALLFTRAHTHPHSGPPTAADPCVVRSCCVVLCCVVRPLLAIVQPIRSIVARSASF
jgi:hypothetical protein